MVSTFSPKVYGNDHLLKTIKDLNLKKESEFRMHVLVFISQHKQSGLVKKNLKVEPFSNYDLD